MSDYYDDGKSHATLYIGISVISLLTIIIGLAIVNSNVHQDSYIMKLDKLYEQKTCDEIPFVEFNMSTDPASLRMTQLLVSEQHEEKYYHSDTDRGWAERYYDKCMQDDFPNGYPNDLELTKYFSNMKCEDLAVHVIKQKFEYPMASNIRTIKCNTPLDRVELPDIVFEQINDIEEIEPIKSNYSNYGSQYELWEKKK